MSKRDFARFIKKDTHLNKDVFIDDYYQNKDKNFFKPTGVQIFTGLQGQGKTISMVKCLIDLKKRYPLCKIVTNLKLTNPLFDDVITFTDSDSLGEVLTGINNDFNGVIYAIDEIHTYFNALDSKNIPMYVFTEISQQRKQRKLILGTSQLFLRLAKPFREQCDHLVICSCIAGKININRVYDGSTLTEDFGKISALPVSVGFFLQTRELRQSYDTFQKVTSGRSEFDLYQLQERIKHEKMMQKKGKKLV